MLKAIFKIFSAKTIKTYWIVGLTLFAIVLPVAQISVYNSTSFQNIREQLPKILNENKLMAGNNLKVFYVSGGLEDEKGTNYDVIVTDFRDYQSLTITTAFKNNKWQIFYVYERGEHGKLIQLYPATNKL